MLQFLVERLQRTEVQVISLVVLTAIVLLLQAAGMPRWLIVLVALSGTGALLGLAWRYRATVGTVEEEGSGGEPLDDALAPTTEQMIYVATPSASSSTTRRLLRIGSHTAPMAPPDLEIQIIVEAWDHAVRLPLNSDDLAQRSVDDLLREVVAAVEAHRPTDCEADFVLTALRSEGPVDSAGRCTWGWTFSFVDGRIGLGCAATRTPYELSLQYFTAPTHLVPEGEARVDVARAIEITRRELPELQTTPLWIRCLLPSDHLVYQATPLWIADVDASADAVRNTTAFRRRMTDASAPEERWSIDDLMGWARGDDPANESLREALTDPVFADGLRTHTEAALRRSGLALWRTHGAETPALLYSLILTTDAPDVAADLTAMLACVPSGLATAALHRLRDTAQLESVRERANDLFERRRFRRIGVAPDPIDRLDFVASRRAMGKACNPRPLALRSVYDEAEIFDGLAQAGLVVTRRRLVSGEFPVLHGAYLRGARGDVEALLSSNALPVPCHVLHLAGGAAESFAQRIEVAGLLYPESEIRGDASSGRPHHVHRAALYMAALRYDWPDCVPSLLAALERGRSDINLRRSVLQALSSIRHPDVEPTLQACADASEDRLAPLARDLLARRREGLFDGPTPAPETSTP
jgi:hypothetical protein